MALLDLSPDQWQALTLLGSGVAAGNAPGGFQAASSLLASAPKRAMDMQMAQMQMEQQRMQMADAQAERQQREQFGQAARSAYITPEAAQARSYGPMPDGSEPPTVAPGFDAKAFLSKAYGIDPFKAMQYEQSMVKDDKPITVAPGASLVNPRTFQPMFTAPDKADKPPSSVQEYQFAVGQGFKGTYADFQLAMRRAGATTVNMDNLGLKPKDRFEMEDKLRADYTKATGADQDIISTASDIKNILAQPGSLKDQAAIYKFAKALDPAGAVREADYAAIVKTAGGLEYLQTLANKALTGEQLSPQQRQQMADVTAAMARVAQQRVTKQQGTYSSRAKMYNLTPQNVFTPSEPTAPTGSAFPDAAKEQRYQEWKARQGK